MDQGKLYTSEVKVGQRVENFKVEGYDAKTNTFNFYSLEENMQAGLWTILLFWPKDFTFVCPTEIIGFSDRFKDFEDVDAKLFGVSTDTVFVHQGWSQVAPEDGGIGQVNYPLLQDANHQLSTQFGILIPEEGVALRGTFIISPDGILEHSTINNLNVGRNVDETYRTLIALQTGGLCPLNWSVGEENL